MSSSESVRRFPQTPISRPNWQDALRTIGASDSSDLKTFLANPNSNVGSPYDRLKTALYDHIQIAMILEMYTIPMYLTAAYSIKSQDANSQKIRADILSISRDEMLHLGLAGNILCAIGGTPRLYNNIPEFPSKLFKSQLKLTLNPAKRETIKLFVDVEAPEERQDDEDVVNANELLPTYNSIGEFYDGLQILLLHTDGILNLGSLLFLGNTVPKQLDSTAFKGLFRVKGPQSALRAVKLIVEQGEGSSLGTDQSHWKRFTDVYEGYDKLHLEYYNVVENIDSKNYTDTEKFKFYPVMVASDAAYSFLFLTLEKLWQTTEPNTREQLVHRNLRGSMRSVLGRLAKFLVQQEIPGSNPTQYAGPPFRRYDFKGNALADLKSWMNKAASAYPQDTELQAAKSKVEEFIDLEA